MMGREDKTFEDNANYEIFLAYTKQLGNGLYTQYTTQQVQQTTIPVTTSMNIFKTGGESPSPQVTVKFNDLLALIENFLRIQVHL